MAQTDKDVRLELSALYRILHMYGMTDLANQCAGALNGFLIKEMM